MQPSDYIINQIEISDSLRILRFEIEGPHFILISTYMESRAANQQF